jgi:ABC-type multidrug transport system fused ATPase/permease subunit
VDAAYALLLLLLALSLSAALALFQGIMTLKLWYVYQVHGVDALLLAIQDAVARGAISRDELEPKFVRRTLRQVQRLGMFSRIVISAINPALRFLAFSTYAVVINPLLTLVVLIALFPTLGLTLLLFARRASRSSRAVLALSTEEAEELTRRLDAAIEGRHLSAHQRPPKTETAFERRVKALTDRLVWAQYSRFFATIISVAAMLIFFVLISNTSFFGDNSWTTIVVYALALFIAFNQLTTLAFSMSMFGKFYPDIHEQMVILQAFSQANSSEEIWQALAKIGLKPTVLDDFEDEEV